LRTTVLDCPIRLSPWTAL